VKDKRRRKEGYEERKGMKRKKEGGSGRSGVALRATIRPSRTLLLNKNKPLRPPTI